MKTDFLILYEHRERELENACLLKYALSKKKFKVRIESIYSFKQHFYEAKVIIVPHLYDEDQVHQFICKYHARKCKIINLQYEQVLSEKESASGYSMPTGMAKNCIIFAWGENEANRYERDTQQEVMVTGCLSMDFNLRYYDKYFFTYNDICNLYKIEKGKKILLFISSFSLSNVSDEYLEAHYPNEISAMKKFAELSYNSKEMILKWLNDYSLDHEDTVIIYRPHPAEMTDDELAYYETNNANFRVIRDYSIRQWIKISEYLATWFSTSIVDAYYAERQCLVLRPVAIPPQMDVPFLANAHVISNYKEFEQSINNAKVKFPISVEKIHKYYSNEIGQSCLDKIVEACICVYGKTEHEYIYNLKHKINFTKTIKTILRDILYDIGVKIDLAGLYAKIYKNNEYKRNFSIKVQQELYKTNKLIKAYLERLNKVYE